MKKNCFPGCVRSSITTYSLDNNFDLNRQQGVRSIKVQQAKKDGTLKLDEHNSSYIVSNDEVCGHNKSNGL